MRRMVLTLMCGALLGGAACSDDTEPAGDTGPSTDAAVDQQVTTDGTPAKEAAVDGAAADSAAGVSFSGQIQPIFTSSCASSSCHGGSAPAAGLDLQAGQAHAALVGVQSAQCTTLKRVQAGQPDQSYLMQKLEGSGTCFSGDPMPKGGAPLGAANISLVKSWISEGAKNN